MRMLAEDGSRQLRAKVSRHAAVAEEWHKQNESKRRYKAALRKATQCAWDGAKYVEELKQISQRKDNEINELRLLLHQVCSEEGLVQFAGVEGEKA